MEHILNIFDWLLYIWFAMNILYLLVYSLASRRRDLPLPPPAKEHKRFAILIPAYREDAVIHECVHSCLEQDYPADCFDTVVISDRMQPETNASLAVLPVRLVEVHFEKSTKSKSLNAAMAAIGNDYDMALLDAISEEINNTIFRLGHAKLGLSAALIGSGMAFRYDLFRDTMADIKAVGGFDRELELTLLYRGKRFYYLPETFVFDEKIQNTGDFSRQRRRWLSAQWHYCQTFAKFLWKALVARNWDFCDKLFQQLSIPRLLLMGFTFLFSVLFTVYRWTWGLKWWLLLVLLAVALLVAVPKRFCTSRLAMALQKIPYTFLLMAGNIFKLRGANKTFIHTRHGVVEK